jgi:ATP-dependent helicase/nuclease subunit A
MTRAKQALIVSGAENSKAGHSWYRCIADAFGFGDAGGAHGDDLVACTGPSAPRPATAVAPEVADTAFPDPALLPALARPIPTGARSGAFTTAATRRGERMHLLLQHLAAPDPITDRSWLQELLDVDHAQFESLWHDAHAILAAPPLQRFFDPSQYLSAQNEVAYVTAAGELRRIDRVVEFADETWVLDYKTGDAPQAAGRYRAQLDAYRQAMVSLFPGKPVRAALVFAGGHLEPL